MPKRIIDYRLIQDILHVNKNLFRYIYEEYWDVIYYHIKKIVKDKDQACDLTNIVFAKAYLSLKLFKPEHKFSSWLYRIATNTAIDYLRNKKLSPDVQHTTEDHNQVADEKTADTDFQHKQNLATLKDAINKLKEPYRNIIKLRYFEENSYEEIAKKLDIPIGTIKAYIHRSKKMLMKLITNK